MKMKIDYFIKAYGVIERGNFYNYMKSLNFKDNILLDRQTMIESSYPFGVCLKKKELFGSTSVLEGCCDTWKWE